MTAIKKGTTKDTKKGAAAEKKKGGVKASAASKKTAAKKAAPRTARKGQKKASLNDIIREKLLSEKNRILSDVSAKIRQESSQEQREIGDIYDIASDERERELSLMLGDRERKKLAEIDLALERINEGTYGVCEECGEPVGEKRLEVLPFTRVCVDCQSRIEREQRITGRAEDEGLLRIIDKSDTDIDSFH
jgi:DnaK suppressor protein